MATLFNKNFKYYELETAFQADGSSIEREPTSRLVRGTVQPMSGEESIPYLQGSRYTGAVKIVCSSRLSTRVSSENKVGYVLHAGNFYELVDESVYGNLMSHFKYVAGLVPRSMLPEPLEDFVED